jgi:stage II sporulation protein D
LLVAPHHRSRPFGDRRAVIVAALLAACVVATAALAAPPAASAADPEASGPTVLGTKVTFHGRGYGHGVGMSQYGARGRALDGQDAATILAHYYQGTELGELATEPTIRVLVLRKWKATSAKPLKIHGRVTEWTLSGVEGVFPPGATLTVAPKGISGGAMSWRLRVTSITGEVLLDQAAPRKFTMRGADETARLKLASKAGTNDIYRGTLRVYLSTTQPVASVVNRLPLELYLRGVVPCEMPASWPTEALRAQAIAARSYAARKLRPGVSSWDTYDDTRSQVYRGVKAERGATDGAIADTADVVLWKGTQVANAMFHSTGGGATENNENVYVSPTGKRIAGVVSYLRGSPDRRDDGSSYDEAAPYATWSMKTYRRSTLSAWFAADPRTNVGSLTKLDLRDRGVSGRLITVTLIGSKGKKKVSGDVFRAVLNRARPAGDPMLRSTLFDTAPIP